MLQLQTYPSNMYYWLFPVFIWSNWSNKYLFDQFDQINTSIMREGEA